MLPDSTTISCAEWEEPQRQELEQSHQGWGRGLGSYCLVGAEFCLGGLKDLQDRVVLATWLGDLANGLEPSLMKGQNDKHGVR